MMGRFIFFIILIILFVAVRFPVKSQVNVLGKPGQVFTPSAEWDSLGYISVSFGHIPDPYAINNFIKVLYGPENIYGIRLPITSFLEVNFNLTRKPEQADLIGAGDRHIDIRIHLLKERAIFPSIVLVLTPPEGESSFLSQDFIVATKNISLGDVGSLRLTGGYSSPYFYRNSRILPQNRGIRTKSSVGNNYLNGFFGSMQWQPWKFFGIMVEHDSQRVNSGVFVQFKDRVILQGNLFGNRELGVTGSVRFPLDFAPYELRRFSRKHKED